MKYRQISQCLIMMVSLPVSALTLPPVPTEPIYYEPPIISKTTEQVALSCTELDLAINELHPYRYTYKPDYYRDGMNQTAAALIVIDAVPLNGLLGIGYLGYSALVEEKESRRMQTVEQEIATLQRVKAQKHCYE